MKKQTLDESFQRLEEYIQKINSIISPISFRDELTAVMDKTSRQRLCEKYPKCWLPLTVGARDIPFLPICSRSGMVDSRMVQFSLKLCRRLNGKENIDQEKLANAMGRLERLHSKYSRDPVKPAGMAYQKGRVTKGLNILKRNLDSIKGNI